MAQRKVVALALNKVDFLKFRLNCFRADFWYKMYQISTGFMSNEAKQDPEFINDANKIEAMHQEITLMKKVVVEKTDPE